MHQRVRVDPLPWQVGLANSVRIRIGPIVVAPVVALTVAVVPYVVQSVFNEDLLRILDEVVVVYYVRIRWLHWIKEIESYRAMFECVSHDLRRRHPRN